LCDAWQSAADLSSGGRAMSDLIENPPHYTWRGGIEPEKFINSNEFIAMEANIIKYIYRYPKKGGLVDLQKAHHNLVQLIQREMGKGTDANGEADATD